MEKGRDWVARTSSEEVGAHCLQLVEISLLQGSQRSSSLWIDETRTMWWDKTRQKSYFFQDKIES